MEAVEISSGSKPPVSPVPNGTTKKTKMDKLKKFNPVSLKKSPKAEKRSDNTICDHPDNSVPLHEALEEARRAVDLFLNNDVVGSRNIVEPL